MRKTALAFAFGFVALFALAAMTRPPVEQLVEGQAPCGNGTAVCMGDKTHAVRLQGTVGINQSGAVPFTPNPDGGLTTLVTANDSIGSTTKALINYQFPSVSGPTVGLTTVCRDSTTATIARCPFGSQLQMGIDQVVGNGQVTLYPYLSAANTVFVRECAVGLTDAGTFAAPDASYLIRCTQ